MFNYLDMYAFSYMHLTYVHVDVGKLIYLCDKHLFDALYHVCIHVIYLKD